MLVDVSPPAKSPRGVFTLAALRARCVVNPATHCWLWQGAKSLQGHPRIHAIDYDRMTKRTQSGPRAAWQIAHDKAVPAGMEVYRACGYGTCLNPVHLRLSIGKATMFAHYVAGKFLRGRRSYDKTIESARKGWEAQSQNITPDDTVRAIRTALPTVTGVELSKRFAISQQTVSSIRRGTSHRWVTP